jgi:hypothetical protein
VDEEVTIRPFAERDAAQVRALFITVNRLLSPLDLRDAFEAYIERALMEEIDLRRAGWRLLGFRQRRQSGRHVRLRARLR